MVRAEKRVLGAFASLRGNPNLEAILAWIAESRNECHLEMESAQSAESLRQLQGYARALADIQQIATSAANP